jgi:DNA polymerase (family 10)
MAETAKNYGPISLDRAKATADAILERLAPFCKKQADGQTPYILVVGSVRRRRQWVNDIDILLIPEDYWNFVNKIKSLGTIKSGGNKIIRLDAGSIPVDIYIASEETWATLMLIRTGSVENNIRLCARAKQRGWILHADGTGLFNQFGKRIAGNSETSIYEALGLVYQPPEERN